MKKRKLSPLLVIGAVLLAGSLCLLAVSQISASVSAQKSQRLVAKINDILPDRTQGTPGIYPDNHMPVLEVDGADYVALLDVPAFGVTLPVADQWDQNKSSRFWGSAYDNTLVIGGKDYSGQFDFCDKIEDGAFVTVTDMTGARFTYTVSRVDRAKHAQTQWLLDENCDLTLFCLDMLSSEYIAVRCLSAYK